MIPLWSSRGRQVAGGVGGVEDDRGLVRVDRARGRRQVVEEPVSGPCGTPSGPSLRARSARRRTSRCSRRSGIASRPRHPERHDSPRSEIGLSLINVIRDRKPADAAAQGSGRRSALARPAGRCRPGCSGPRRRRSPCGPGRGPPSRRRGCCGSWRGTAVGSIVQRASGSMIVTSASAPGRRVPLAMPEKLRGVDR